MERLTVSNRTASDLPRDRQRGIAADVAADQRVLALVRVLHDRRVFEADRFCWVEAQPKFPK